MTALAPLMMMMKRSVTLETLRINQPRRSPHAPPLIRLHAHHPTSPPDPLPHSSHLHHNPLPPQDHSPPDYGILLPRSPPQNHSTPNTLGRIAIPWVFALLLDTPLTLSPPHQCDLTAHFTLSAPERALNAFSSTPILSYCALQPARFLAH